MQALRALLVRHLGIGGLLVAFTVTDAVGAAIVLKLAGQPAFGIAAGLTAVAVALAGYRLTMPSFQRGAALLGVVGLVVLLPQVVLISEQTLHSPLHDGILLTDAAGDLLLRGQDPYGHDYIDTAARTFFLSDTPVNFGLGHYVYMPGMILADLPIRALHSLTPYANFSWLFLVGLGALAAAAWSMGWTRTAAEGYLVAVVLNPLFQLDYLYFLNDLFFLAPLLACVAAARRDRPAWAGAMFGVAICFKQQAVLLLPLTLWYCWLHWNDKRWHRAIAGFFAVALPVIVPFLAWDPAAFLRDTTAFFFGSGTDSYPIRGLGLPGQLLRLQLIDSRWQSFPIGTAIEVAAALAVLAAAARNLYRGFTWPRFWLWNALLAFVVFFFGRVLSPNYFDLVVTLLLLALVSWLVDLDPLEIPAVGENAGPGGGRVPNPA